MGPHRESSRTTPLLAKASGQTQGQPPASDIGQKMAVCLRNPPENEVPAMEEAITHSLLGLCQSGAQIQCIAQKPTWALSIIQSDSGEDSLPLSEKQAHLF